MKILIVFGILTSCVFALPAESDAVTFKGQIVDWIYRGGIKYSRTQEVSSSEYEVSSHYILVIKVSNPNDELRQQLKTISNLITSIDFGDPIFKRIDVYNKRLNQNGLDEILYVIIPSKNLDDMIKRDKIIRVINYKIMVAGHIVVKSGSYKLLIE